MAELSTQAREDLATLIQRISRALTAERAWSAGDVAELRRMDPRAPPAAFFKLAAVYLGPELPTLEPARSGAETRWAAIVLALATLGELHHGGSRLGHGLGRGQFSELRFSRLIRADVDRLIDDVPAVARYLAAKGVGVDGADLARLILSSDRTDEEATRRHIARDYYAAIASA